MAEAVAELYTPAQLRFLFASVLIDMPIDSLKLYTDFLDDMSWDLKMYETNEPWIDIMLCAIQRHLHVRGASLQRFNLPMPAIPSTELESERAAFQGKEAQMREFVSNARSTFNDEQAQVYQYFESVLQADDLPRLHFLDGKAGRGKTFLMNCLVTQFRAESHVVLVVGSTALSVIHYDRGRTAHSAFGIPVKEVCYICSIYSLSLC
jgi:PIF1-like helicase